MSERKARDGICRFINNDPMGAEAFFNEPSEDVEMRAGKCFISLINALLSYDPERFAEAEAALRALEADCMEEVGWVESMKNSVFGSSVSLADPELPERLKKQIILADCMVCEALLIFFRQDFGAYVKGGWRLRQAWKVYQRTYGVIQDLYERAFGDDSAGMVKSASADMVSDETPSSSLTKSTSFIGSALSGLSSFWSTPKEENSAIEPCVVERLMFEVSFGYGIYQLCVSLLPPNYLRIVHLLGVEGDRKTGLAALKTAKKAEMRGPLALLALLWYHTIVRPYLALDGGNVRSGERVACLLYDESKKEFSDSAFFIFFLGKIERMKGNIPDALKAFEKTIEKSPQNEMKWLCHHEIGWCYLIQLAWKDAYVQFEKLAQPSRWGELFYTYKMAICLGADGEKIEEAIKLFISLKEMLETIAHSTVIDQFIARRVRKVGGSVNKDSCTLLALELLYLWNALPSCDAEAVVRLAEECTEEPMVGLREFLRGVARSYKGELDIAQACFKICLEQRKDIVGDSKDPDNNDDHVSAFCGLELGTLKLKRPEEKAAGKKLLKETSERYSGYDFEHKINVRIPSALRWS